MPSPMAKFYTALLLSCSFLRVQAQPAGKADELLQLIHTFSKTSAVTGREEEAAAFVESLFAAGTLKKDKLGNLVVSIGSGAPKRLFVAPLDEPGYVISQIQDNGYLRIAPVGYGHAGPMFHQFLQGNEVKINTTTAVRYGVAVVPSSHFDGLRAVPERSRGVYQWQEAFIDVGMASSGEVAATGLQLLDPVTTNKKPALLYGEAIAGPSAKEKSAVIALATVAKTLMQSTFSGTVIIAFTTLELLNGKGLETVVNTYGPFNQVVRFNRFLDGAPADRPDILVDTRLPYTAQTQRIVAPAIPFRHPATSGPDWADARVYTIGLPSAYTSTPVELVHLSAVQQLISAWLSAVDQKTWTVAGLTKSPLAAPDPVYTSFRKETDLLTKLVSLYGVSGAEKPVRAYILSSLPTWAKPVTDAKGNVSVTFGKGKQHIAFVAHMDEVGYVVDTIRDDGRLTLKQLGGFFNSVWEGHSAIIHTTDNEIPAIFEPRPTYLKATSRLNGTSTPTVFAGFTSRQQAVAAGIAEGVTTVTMPKKMLRLSEYKATARGFDDRVGCASLLLALQNLDPARLPFTVTFVWSVEEETGLAGSTFAAKNLRDVRVVYPIDTFVSSDDPVESKQFAYCPLGNGAVIRVLESINFVKPANLQYLQALALKNRIKTQYGMTAGGTDGQGFLPYNIPSVPLSWPGRYSHSPIEIMDFRDLNSLVSLIKAILQDGSNTYD